MKSNTLRYLLTAVSIAIISNAYSQSATKEDAVNKVFKALSQKDEKAWVRLFPDAKTTIEFITGMMANEQDSLDPAMGEMMKEFMDKISDSSLQAEYGRDFRKHMKKADKIGLDFSKAKIVKTIIDSSLEEETQTPKLTGKLYFNANQKEYFLAYSDILLFEGKGWYGVEIERIDLMSRENEPEEFDPSDYEMDSTIIISDTTMGMIAVDTTVQVPMEEKKEVPAKKPADNKTKTKSKSPAKKDD